MELVDLHEDVAVDVLAEGALTTGLVGNQRLEHRPDLMGKIYNVIRIRSLNIKAHFYEIIWKLCMVFKVKTN